MTLAVALAAGTTQAQSVSIYGTVDTSLQTYSNSIERFTRSNDHGYSTGRLGFRASEDLGRGTKALINLEGQLNASAGQFGANNEPFNREAWVGLAGGFGEVRLGRTDVSQSSNLDILATHAGNWSGTAINGTPLELGVFQKNVVRYASPSVAGFQGTVGYSSGNDTGSIQDANSRQMGASVTFQQRALKVGVGYHKNHAASEAAERNMKGIVAAYDFGFAKASVLHVRGDNSVTRHVDSRSSNVGLTVPLKRDVAVALAYHVTTNGEYSSNNAGRGGVVGITKDLSKRTKLYGGYAQVSNQANSNMFINGVTSPAQISGLGAKTAFAGVNHTF